MEHIKGSQKVIKRAPMAKGGTIQQQNKVVLDCNPKYK